VVLEIYMLSVEIQLVLPLQLQSNQPQSFVLEAPRADIFIPYYFYFVRARPHTFQSISYTEFQQTNEPIVVPHGGSTH
jgi:hypothetical protein